MKPGFYFRVGQTTASQMFSSSPPKSRHTHVTWRESKDWNWQLWSILYRRRCMFASN